MRALPGHLPTDVRRAPRGPASLLLPTLLLAAATGCGDSTGLADHAVDRPSAASAPMLLPLAGDVTNGGPLPIAGRATTAGPSGAAPNDAASAGSVPGLPGTFARVAAAPSFALLWQNVSTGERSVRPLAGTSWAGDYATIGGAGGSGWVVAATGDVDGDGDLDIVWESPATGEHGIWTMAGPGGATWTGSWRSLGVSMPTWHVAAAADLTGDGRAELLWENSSTGERGVSQLAGMSLGTYTPLGTLSPVWHIAAAADLTQDGRADVVVENTTTGERGVWPMVGTRWSGAYRTIATVSPAWRVAGAADLTGDGQPDLLLENPAARQLSIWAMNGSVPTGVQHVLTGAGAPWRLGGVLGVLPAPGAAGAGQGAGGVTSISVTPAAATIAVGATVQVAPFLTTSAAGANTAVTYASSDAAVATVDPSGTVRGVAPGEASIVVTSVADPALRASARVTVVSAGDLVAGLTVQPTSVTLSAGTTRQLAATVTLAAGAPQGTPATVTYASSDPEVATVSPTGLLTASANGTAMVTVRSVAAPSVAQQVSVVVRDAVLPRIAIQSVRVLDALGRLVPADLSNVRGALFVAVQVDPGDFIPESVQLRLGARTVTCLQSFASELAAAYRLALTTGSADVRSIDCTVDTRTFDAATGAPDYLNGRQSLGAELVSRPSPAGTTEITSVAVPGGVVLANVSGVYVDRATITNTPTAAQAAVDPDGVATGPQGVEWRAGSLRVKLLPVSYSGQPAAASFTVTLQDRNGVVARRTATRDAGAASFSATFPGGSADAFDATPAASDRLLDGYTSPGAGTAAAFNAQGAYTGGGTIVAIGTAAGVGGTIVLDAGGQPAGFANVAENTVGAPIFIDDQTPQPAVNFGPDGGVAGPPAPNFAYTGTGFVGYVGAAFEFRTRLAPQFLHDPANAFEPATGNPDFGGVDRVTTQYFAGTSASVATLAAGTPVVAGADLAPAASASAYALAVAMTDALGNRRVQRVQSGPGGASMTASVDGTSVSGGQNVSFGVDLGAPVIAQYAGPTVDATYATLTAPGLNLGFAGSDDVGFGPNPILVTASRTARAVSGNAQQTVGGTTQTFCAVAVDVMTRQLVFATAAGGTCAPIPTIGNLYVPTLGGTYRVAAQARDQAGNLSGAISRNVVVETSVP